jgi:Rieske Fe-S protein
VKPRRRFLKVVAAVSLAACATETGDDSSSGALSGGANNTTGEPEFPEGYRFLGTIETFPEGSFIVIPALQMLIAHDAGGIYAMTSRCTHENCDTVGNDGTSGEGITTCGCHGSVFGANGEVLSGPATDPLPHFACLVDEDGNIAVNKDIVVGIDDRAPT